MHVDNDKWQNYVSVIETVIFNRMISNILFFEDFLILYRLYAIWTGLVQGSLTMNLYAVTCILYRVTVVANNEAAIICFFIVNVENMISQLKNDIV